MKMKHFLSAAAIAVTATLSAQDLPQPSPRGEVEQIVGLTKVEVEYNRPNARGRKVFGEVVPFDKVWRTGANKCTSIELDGPVMVEGQLLKPGKYSVFTIPGKESWQVIFNSNTELWGEGDRKPEEDVLTVKVKAMEVKEPVETFTIGFSNVTDDKANMDMSWEHTRISIELYADATEKAMDNIKKAMADDKVTFGTYHSSARFLLDRKMKPEQALEWAEKSVKMESRYWNVYTLALAYEANGKTKEAIMQAEVTKKLATEAKADGYVRMAEEKIKELGGARKQLAPAQVAPGK